MSSSAASNDTKSNDNQEATPTQSWISHVLVPGMCGVAFGAVFQLSRVHEFYFIKDQFLMRHFVMLKMFLSAAAVSTSVLTLLPLLSSRASGRVGRWRGVMCETVGEHRGLPALIIGGGLLGIGMQLTGSCPGTVFAQVAAGSVQARYILAGGLIGATLFPLVEGSQAVKNLMLLGRKGWQKLSLDRLIGANKTSVGVTLSAALLSLVGVVEYFSPWRSELSDLLSASDIQKQGSVIAPWVAGAVVGLLQLPLILIVNNHLGCSSSYVTCAANLCSVFSRKADGVPLFSQLKTNYWQVLLMGGVMCGSYLAAANSGSLFLSDSLVSTPAALVGGAVMVVGARIAAGCTSGHGISGMGYLALNSFVAVASMFGFGILTAVVRNFL